MYKFPSLCQSGLPEQARGTLTCFIMQTDIQMLRNNAAFSMAVLPGC